MADIGEALREYVLLALPMYPVSPGSRASTVSYSSEAEGAEQAEQGEEAVDHRLAVLKRLLDTNDER